MEVIIFILGIMAILSFVISSIYLIIFLREQNEIYFDIAIKLYITGVIIDIILIILSVVKNF